jgi:hypothetical protein
LGFARLGSLGRLLNDLLGLERFDVVDRCVYALQRRVNPVQPAEDLVIVLELATYGV